MSKNIDCLWIGKKLCVVESLNPSLVGRCGFVVDETKNLFFLDTFNGLKKIVKSVVIVREVA